MSQFSEMMGSFIRTGNYPMEANYIFPTEAALKEFYNDPINATTLHKGLLKVVENGGDGKQALYWVVKKQTNDDLEFVKLIENIDIDTIDGQLESLQKELEKEIKNRKDGETAIWGTNDPTNVPEELNSLLDLATAVTNLIKEVQDIHKELIDSDESIHKSLKTEIKATVGTQEDDIVSYLKTLPYKSLTEAANALNKFLNTTDSDSNQINTLPELQFFLEGYTDTQKLRHVLLDLQAEILGNPLPTQEFRTLRAIEDFVRILKADSESSDKNIQSELDNTQIGVGLSGDGSYNADKETYYLKDATSIMNALKVLDSLMYEALKGITIKASNEDVVDLNVRKELEGYVIGAKLNLSNVLGNDLIKKEDGLYFNVKSTYNNGTLSLYVNDKLVAQHILGFSSIVESAFYDSSNESIVIVFKLLSGEKQTITIPVGTLIRELEVDNSQPDKVVELVRETVIDGADKLSADVRIHSDKHNILKKVGNTLSVDGTTDSITHNDKTLSSVIEEIKTTESESTSTLTQKINSEIDRAKAEEESIKTSLEEVKDNTDKAISDLKLKDSEIQAAVLAETNRATEAENNLKTSVQDLKDSDSAIKESIEEVKISVQNNAREITSTKNLIGLEAERAQSAEETLTQRASAIEAELSNISKQQVDTGKEVVSLTNKLDAEITRSTNKDSELADAISKETARATEQEKVLATTLDTKVGTVTIKKSEVSDLQYILYVDGKASGEINIPDDQFLQDVKYDSVSKSLVFTFITKEGTKEGTKVVSVSLSDLIDTYAAGDGLQLENNKFSVRKCLGSQKYLEISSDGLSIVGIDEALASKANVGDSYTKAESDAKYLTEHQDISSLATKDEVKEVSTEITKTNSNLQKEIERATAAETNLLQKIGTKVETVILTKVSDLQYDITVNGTSIGKIDIPKDQFLKSVTLEGKSTLRFVFETTTGTVTTDINLEDVVADALSELEAKVNKKADIDSPVFTGVPQVAVSPDASDASQRIPSTNWVRDRIQEEVSKIDVTAYITRADVEKMVAKKADLVDGKVPLSQLPVNNWIDVE